MVSELRVLLHAVPLAAVSRSREAPLRRLSSPLRLKMTTCEMLKEPPRSTAHHASPAVALCKRCTMFPEDESIVITPSTTAEAG